MQTVLTDGAGAAADVADAASIGTKVLDTATLAEQAPTIETLGTDSIGIEEHVNDYLSFTDRSTAENWANTNYAQWERSLTPEEYEGVRAYTDSNYQNINGVLRGYIPQFEGRNGQFAEQTARALDKASVPENIIVYHGTGVSALGDLKNLSPREWVGQEFNDKGFMSTSLLQDGAFSNELSLLIHVPKGANGAFVGNLSHYPNEVELLLNNNQTLKILQVDCSNPSNIKLTCELQLKQK